MSQPGNIAHGKRGFWMDLGDGSTAHINGDPNMSQETRTALLELCKVAVANIDEIRAADGRRKR